METKDVEPRDITEPKTSRDIRGPDTRKDSQRDQEHAAIKDGEKTDQSDRDKVHGDGHDIGIDRK